MIRGTWLPRGGQMEMRRFVTGFGLGSNLAVLGLYFAVGTPTPQEEVCRPVKQSKRPDMPDIALVALRGHQLIVRGGYRHYRTQTIALVPGATEVTSSEPFFTVRMKDGLPSSVLFRSRRYLAEDRKHGRLSAGWSEEALRDLPLMCELENQYVPDPPSVRVRLEASESGRAFLLVVAWLDSLTHS